MKNEQIEFIVKSVNHWTPSVIRGNYIEVENIVAEDSGGQELEMTRFIPPRKFRVKIGQIYEGTKKAPNNPEYNDTVNELKPLNGFGGIEALGKDCWDYTDPAHEQLERQCSILAQSDIHSGIHIATAFLVEQMRLGNSTGKEDTIKLIIEYSLICRDARLELTRQYINMDKDRK